MSKSYKVSVKIKYEDGVKVDHEEVFECSSSVEATLCMMQSKKFYFLTGVDGVSIKIKAKPLGAK